VLHGELELFIKGELLSRAYIEMTMEVIEAFGGAVSWEGEVIKVPYKPYQPTRFEVEADASSASYFLIVPLVLGEGEVEIENYAYPSRQADSKLIEFLKEMGAEVRVLSPKGIKVSFRGRPEGGEFDLGDCPDLFPTMCILSAVARGRTVLKGAPHLRYKETDRISAMATELKKVGVAVEELPDGLVIEGREEFLPASISTYNDHRIAMSFAILGLKTGGLEIENPECVEKSFPEFWDCLEKLYESK
jgi:3-phosphoshikimate 1-carboxyvinyltransferase